MKDGDNKVPRLGFIRAVESPWLPKHDEIAPADLMKSAVLLEKHREPPACTKIWPRLQKEISTNNNNK